MHQCLSLASHDNPKNLETKWIVRELSCVLPRSLLNLLKEMCFGSVAHLARCTLFGTATCSLGLLKLDLILGTTLESQA